LSNATPRKSPSRQIRRHHRIVKKLSKVNSKLFGSTDKSRVRSLAPFSDISTILQPRAPTCPLKNRSAPFSILVLPTARDRCWSSVSFSVPIVFDEFLVLPVAPVKSSPDAAANQTARDGPSGKYDGPEMPQLSGCWLQAFCVTRTKSGKHRAVSNQFC
jgi:hypothetical protein